jgi:hypothetical protein
MRYFSIQSVIMFALGVAVGSALLGGLPQQAQAVSTPIITGSVNAQCTSDDAVADFVCRNTWIANSRHSYR